MPTTCSKRQAQELTFRLAVEAVRPGGQVVWLGKINVNEEVSFRWGSLMGERRIVRSSYGDARPRRDFPWIVHEYLEGRLKLDELITNRITLDRDQRRLRLARPRRGHPHRRHVRLAWIIHEGLGMMASRVASQFRLDRRCQ